LRVVHLLSQALFGLLTRKSST